MPLFMDDPQWADFIPDMKQGGPKCRLPTHEDCTPLDVERTAKHLESDGTLGGMEGYEPRPGQLDMLRAVTHAFNNREHLMIEAGTGVGKSLAYIVPSVLWSFTNDTPVILSTATRNLQSQLLSSDLPRATKVLGEDASKLRVTVLKGRANYLCLRMLGELMQGGWWTLSADEREDFTRLYEWLHATVDGDLDDLGLERMRPQLSCPGEDCHGRSCRYHEKCFVAKARARAQRAHLVVANHALVLSEAVNAASTLLPAYGRIVFDEAHNLEDIATDFFSYELSRPVLTQLLGRLSRTSRSRRGVSRPRGVLGAVERQLQKGGLSNPVDAEEIRDLLLRAQVQIKFSMSAGDALFDVLRRLFSPVPRGTDRIRFRCVPSGPPGGGPGSVPVRQHSVHGLFADYSPDEWDEAALDEVAVRFEDALARLQGIVVGLAEALERVAAGGEMPVFGDLAQQMRAIAASFTEFILESKFVMAASDPSRVYWAERRPGDAGAKQPAYFGLTAAPLSVATELKQCFYDAKDTVVLCSATLRTGDRFDYMAKRLGISLLEPHRVKALTASSPFDYFRQALVLAADCLPDPSSSPREYAEELAPFLRDIFLVTGGRALVLFTSYDMMRDVAERVRGLLDQQDVRLMVQGEGESREAMAEALRTADVPTVLFGSQSFWEGVDVPGAALSCVILARLPFPQVGEPIVEARGEKVTEEGGSAFRDYLLPEAVIRFRQGFGRLVRTKSDRGVVVVADGRIVTKNYGASFRKAIPASVHACSSLSEMVSRTADFLESVP